MRTRLMTIAALVGAGALTLNAQAPQPQQPPSTPEAQRPAGEPMDRAANDKNQVITISGCLKEEKDVPGRTPNPAERVGITEDYILTDVKMAASSAVSGIGLATSYEVEGIAEDELKKHLNHQVELTGRIAAAATGADDSADFQATSLKMVSATCPAPK